MLTQEPTEVKQVAEKPRWSRAIVAFAATIAIVAAAVGVWAMNSDDGGPVAAGDARIEVTFTGDGTAYSGHRQITEGLGEVTVINEAPSTWGVMVQRFVPGSHQLAAELALAPEGGDFVSSLGQPSRMVAAYDGIPGESTQPILLEPGIYILDFGNAEGDLTYIYRAAVIEVVAAD